MLQCTGARVRMMSRVMTRIYDNHLRPLGIKFSQLNILVLITVRGPIAPHQIATPLGFEKSTLSRNLRILEERGWIDSQPGDSRNRLLLSITPAGRQLVRQAGPLWRAAQDEVTSVLDKGTIEAIRRAFEHVQQFEKAD